MQMHLLEFVRPSPRGLRPSGLLYCERQFSRLIDQTLRSPSQSPSGNRPLLSKYGDEIVQDSHLLPFSADICCGPFYSSGMIPGTLRMIFYLSDDFIHP